VGEIAHTYTFHGRKRLRRCISRSWKNDSVARTHEHALAGISRVLYCVCTDLVKPFRKVQVALVACNEHERFPEPAWFHQIKANWARKKKDGGKTAHQENMALFDSVLLDVLDTLCTTRASPVYRPSVILGALVKEPLSHMYMAIETSCMLRGRKKKKKYRATKVRKEV